MKLNIGFLVNIHFIYCTKCIKRIQKVLYGIGTITRSDDGQGVLLWLSLLHRLDVILTVFHKHQPLKVTIRQGGSLGSQNIVVYKK